MIKIKINFIKNLLYNLYIFKKLHFNLLNNIIIFMYVIDWE